MRTIQEIAEAMCALAEKERGEREGSVFVEQRALDSEMRAAQALEQTRAADIANRVNEAGEVRNRELAISEEENRRLRKEDYEDAIRARAAQTEELKTHNAAAREIWREGFANIAAAIRERQ